MIPTGKSITTRIAELQEAAARAQAGTLDPQQTTDALIAASALVTLLDLRAFEVSTDIGSDDLKELVVLTVHGVDLEIRGRSRPHSGPEIYVHIDDQRDDEDRTHMPLIVDIDTS